MMAEVVDWSPVDDDNDSAPPVGAPEGMLPSGVNNTMRAMMGSLRRMYDKLISAETVLPYLPTAGGTVTGDVAINGTYGLALSGVLLRGISNGLEVYHAGGGGFTSRGPGAGYSFGDHDQVSATWGWYANGGLSYLRNAATGNVLSVTNLGAMSLATSVDTPRYKIAGVSFAERGADNAHVIYDSDGQLAIALYGSAGSQNYYRADAHNFQNNAAGNTVTINSAGDLAATRHVSAGGNITSTGAMSASGNITAGGQITGALLVSTNDISATDAISAGGTISGATVTASGVLSSAGTLFIAGNGEVNGTLAVGGTVFATGFTDTNGFVVVTELQALMARVAALETLARG